MVGGWSVRTQKDDSGSSRARFKHCSYRCTAGLGHTQGFSPASHQQVCFCKAGNLHTQLNLAGIFSHYHYTGTQQSISFPKRGGDCFSRSSSFFIQCFLHYITVVTMCFCLRPIRWTFKAEQTYICHITPHNYSAYVQ